ncbi:MAG TPA: extracellular solute-binding protein [Anaerolineales bacterium]|nr:extracellular solute-binding protein [Anaerolineales bacterium]
MNRQQLGWVFFCLLGWLLLGCQPTLSVAPVTPTASPIAPSNLQTNSPENAGTPKVSLVIWVSQDMAEGAGYQLFQERLEKFVASRPNFEIKLRVKARSGGAGMVTALNAVQKAAPANAPDVVLLNSGQVWQAMSNQLLQPLKMDWSGELPAELPVNIVAPVYLENEIYGLPFAANPWVLASNADLDEQVIPTWRSILASKARVGFAAADVSSNFAVQGYLAGGGNFNLDAETNKLDVQRVAVLRFFNWLATLKRDDMLLPDLFILQSREDIWSLLNNSRSAIFTDYRTYQRNVQQSASAPQILPVPMSEEQTPLYVSEVWYFAITTTDSQRQAEAQALLDLLLQPEFLAQWASADGFFPLSPQVVQNQIPTVLAFQRQVLPAMTIRPAPELFDPLHNALQKGVTALLQDGQTAQQSTQVTMDALDTP